MKCPQYHFSNFCSYRRKLDNGAVTCSGISLATYPNHTDCDYQLEFIIGNTIPNEVYISSTSWRGRLVLKSGKTAYRLDGDKLFVLIGKVRFDWLRVKPHHFRIQTE